MPTVNSLTDSQILALTRFVEGCLRLRGSTQWRTIFCDCALRGHFSPFLRPEDAKCLRQLLENFGPVVVCQFKTSDLLRAAQKLT